MHIYFSGIGGTAIGPLAQIAQQAGYSVSGSDKRASDYLAYLIKNGISDIHIGQSYEVIAAVHARNPIDWVVFSSAVFLEQVEPEEVRFCKENDIHFSKRDELLNKIILDKKLKLLAIAGTHGKTTTTAMLIWLMQQTEIPVSWSVGAKIGSGNMGSYSPASEYFIYEADEFDRNFLAFKPYISIITGIDYDHQEIFPSLQDYQIAFKQFLTQSTSKIVWQSDVDVCGIDTDNSYEILADEDDNINTLHLTGAVNRRNAWQVVKCVHTLTSKPIAELMSLVETFPGLSRRFEKLGENIYTDYAHTIEKIRGCLGTASELSKKVVVVYEPLTNRRQHFVRKDYKDLFEGVKQLYWVPSYLAREDPAQIILSPNDLIQEISNQQIATASDLDDQLWEAIQAHRNAGDLVVCISGGGGESLDEWVRSKISNN